MMTFVFRAEITFVGATHSQVNIKTFSDLIDHFRRILNRQFQYLTGILFGYSFDILKSILRKRISQFLQNKPDIIGTVPFTAKLLGGKIRAVGFGYYA